MQSEIQVIQADLHNPQHASALIFLLNEYAKDEMGGGEELKDFVKENLVASLKHRPGVHVVLAFADSKPAGLANCFEGFSTFVGKPLLNIHDFAVAPEFRGRGIAKKLMEKIEEIARSLDCCKITLEVLEGNKVAQAAYKACGFAGYELDPKMGRAMFWQKKL
ncbi:N-acetyltransferase [Cellvibrio zantedeschiae]|uniref:N-acetyltransferase n=1 Tax=Cellvibrio zantedeschiae TaxID=1237077 RepID=A0ABQ3BBA5_9GAMM|nr:GNAT family N-acetyltransferase [Cellvibrio zantedeschiae]GGY86055.1 N-acetyltransferase [Cellvibrio zantedeschiae]